MKSKFLAASILIPFVIINLIGLIEVYNYRSTQTQLINYVLNMPTKQAQPVVINIDKPTGTMPQALALDLLNSTVKVLCGGGNGSGVIISSITEITSGIAQTKTRVITNNHVVGVNTAVFVEQPQYKNYGEIKVICRYPGKVLRRDAEVDLALIEVVSDVPIGVVAGIADDQEIRTTKLYDQIYICGCGLGNNPLITEGHIANIEQTEWLTTAFAIFGNSGGGAYNMSGKLLGVMAQISIVRGSDGFAHPEPNLSKIIPVQVLKDWLKTYH